jgi:hypothetical protein
MISASLFESGFRKVRASSLVLLLVGCGYILPASAASLTELQQQQAALQQQAQQSKAAALAQEPIAQRAAERLAQATAQISQLHTNIGTTQQQVADVQAQIAQKDQQAAQLDSLLRQDQDQQDSLVREMFIMRKSQPDILSLFSDAPVSQREEQQAQFQAIEKAVKAASESTAAQQREVAAAKADLSAKQNSLVALQSQQSQQVVVLGDVQQQQADLQANAVAAETALEAKAAQAQAQATVIAQKIRALQSTASWGNQIVSSYVPSWYFTQTGDYDTLGNSGYTVNDVGCYVTSIAMVAAFYGNHSGPDYIADHGSFFSGYLAALPPLNISLQPGGAVNWGVVNSEIAAGRPVIVSIYLPQVGALNSDGSSHFIVIWGQADGKYLMQDPIAASGRSYNLNQVRSMVLVRKK